MECIRCGEDKRIGTTCDICGIFECNDCQGLTEEEMVGLDSGMCSECQKKYNIKCHSCQ